MKFFHGKGFTIRLDQIAALGPVYDIGDKLHAFSVYFTGGGYIQIADSAKGTVDLFRKELETQWKESL